MKRDDIDMGRQLALLGAETAADHADRVHGDWSMRAWDYFVRFAKNSKDPFMTEDVRTMAALDRAVPDAPDDRAWGAIALRAAKARLIRRVGYAPNKSLSCHGSPKSVWVWVG